MGFRYYNIGDGLKTDRKHYRMIEQMETACTSVAMNIAERQFKSVPPTAPLGLASEPDGKGSARGAVFKEAGRHLVVLTGDFLAGSAVRMTDGRKKRKGFHWFGLERSI